MQVQRLKDGRRAVILDEKVKAAFITTIGDTDGDSKNGVRSAVFVDIPFDGSDMPQPLYDTKEQFEDVSTDELYAKVGQAFGFLQGLLKR